MTGLVQTKLEEMSWVAKQLMPSNMRIRLKSRRQEFGSMIFTVRCYCSLGRKVEPYAITLLPLCLDIQLGRTAIDDPGELHLDQIKADIARRQRSTGDFQRF